MGRHLSVSGANEMLSPSLDLLESLVKKQMPFFVIRVSTEDQPIAILKYNLKAQENKKIGDCKKPHFKNVRLFLSDIRREWDQVLVIRQ
jgi:hypothetical protein